METMRVLILMGLNMEGILIFLLIVIKWLTHIEKFDLNRYSEKDGVSDFTALKMTMHELTRLDLVLVILGIPLFIVIYIIEKIVIYLNTPLFKKKDMNTKQGLSEE